MERHECAHQVSRRFVDMVSKLLDRGSKAGVFRPDIDPVQLNITIAAIGYYYPTNRHRGSIIFKRAFMASEALSARLQFNVDTIVRLVCRQVERTITTAGVSLVEKTAAQELTIIPTRLFSCPYFQENKRLPVPASPEQHLVAIQCPRPVNRH